MANDERAAMNLLRASMLWQEAVAISPNPDRQPTSISLLPSGDYKLNYADELEPAKPPAEPKPSPKKKSRVVMTFTRGADGKEATHTYAEGDLGNTTFINGDGWLGYLS